jgi:formiminotetrahydrofolate cyclodeaminase
MAVEPDYLAMPTASLLECFAEGKATPGVGSATGLAGALAAALAETVGKLTQKKDKYHAFHARALTIQLRANALRTALGETISEDADVFHEVIAARNRRDAAETETEKYAHENVAQQFLVRAIETPLRIAEASAEIVSLGVELFHSGFKSARGDSRTAVALAAASVEASLGVVELNLKLRKHNDQWASERMGDVTRIWSMVVAERDRLPPLPKYESLAATG